MPLYQSPPNHEIGSRFVVQLPLPPYLANRAKPSPTCHTILRVCRLRFGLRGRGGERMPCECTESFKAGMYFLVCFALIFALVVATLLSVYLVSGMRRAALELACFTSRRSQRERQHVVSVLTTRNTLRLNKRQISLLCCKPPACRGTAERTALQIPAR